MEPVSSAQDSTATTSGMDVSRQSILPFGDLKERVGVSACRWCARKTPKVATQYTRCGSELLREEEESAVGLRNTGLY
ncbi:hypothetical protein G5I_13504 [Acromyrmex echinatior]|uniref:Uncharacterized protein n=1 Tax=Acromyrmex echinatior TaxID=103372 RepID=F4X579_ACREC|nr:hypothetical protein G5I_13504 [Acromyrmex echinatior]